MCPAGTGRLLLVGAALQMGKRLSEQPAFESPVPLSVPPWCFLRPRGGPSCAALRFGPWGGGQNPAWGPVLVVKAFLQTCPRWGWEGDLPAAGGWLRAARELPGAALPTPDRAPAPAHLSPPGPVHVPDPQLRVPSPHTLLPHLLAGSRPCFSPARTSPPSHLPACPHSSSVTSSPQLQGGTLSTSLQSRPSQPSHRSRSPRSRPPPPSPTAPSVRAGGAGRGRFGPVGTVTHPCPVWGGSSRAGRAARGCSLGWPKLVPTWNYACRNGLGLLHSQGGSSGPCVHPHPQPCCFLREELRHAVPHRIEL